MLSCSCPSLNKTGKREVARLLLHAKPVNHVTYKNMLWEYSCLIIETTTNVATLHYSLPHVLFLWEWRRNLVRNRKLRIFCQGVVVQIYLLHGKHTTILDFLRLTFHIRVTPLFSSSTILLQFFFTLMILVRYVFENCVWLVIACMLPCDRQGPITCHTIYL